MENMNLLFSGSGLFLGALLTLCVFWIRRKQRQVQVELAKSTATRVIDEAKKEASAIKREGEIQAKDGILTARVDLEKEARETRKELQTLEKRLAQGEEGLNKRADTVEKQESEIGKRESSIQGREKTVGEREAESKRLINEARNQLERLAEMSLDEAKKSLVDQML